MSLILGTIVREQINIDNQQTIIKEILTQIKHYLTLQTSIIIQDNHHCLQISSTRNTAKQPQSQHSNTFTIPKNFHYLFTHWQCITVDNQDDLQFFDVCYQCLMIIKEYLPTKISIGVKIMEDLNNQSGFGTQTDPLSLNEFVENFESQKNEQFCRRVNSNFKTLLTIHQSQINRFQIENILHLCQHFYLYKNKLAALKFIAQHKNIDKRDLAELHDKYVEFLNQICLDEDFRQYSAQILQKIQIAKEIIRDSNINTLQQNCTEELSSQSQNIHKSQSYELSKSNQIKKNNLPNQKQLRSSNHQNESNSQNSNLFEQNNRQPLKPLNKTYQQKGNFLKKEDKLLNISPKSILFQLRQSQSIKRLTMLINTASEMNFDDVKIEQKITKQIENICRNFLKSTYSTINEQIADQATRFYQGLQKYFSKKQSSTQSGWKMKGGKQNGNKVHIQWKKRQLLSKVCKKIQRQLCMNDKNEMY